MHAGFRTEKLELKTDCGPADVYYSAKNFRGAYTSQKFFCLILDDSAIFGLFVRIYFQFKFFRHAELTLSELYLSHNMIRNITREVFGSMHQLQYLDLSHNLIFDIEYDCFKKVKHLQVCFYNFHLVKY